MNNSGEAKMKKRGRVLFLSSEAHPLAKTGGLADVAGSLPKALHKIGYEVAISLPLYRKAFPSYLPLEKLTDIESPGKEGVKKGELYRTFVDKDLPIFLISQKDYFDRDNLYGDEKGDYPDNLERFSFFCKALLFALQKIEWRPEIIHCNDWQTALIPLYLKNLSFPDSFFVRVVSLFTIHNLAYQGIFPKEKLSALGLDEEFFVPSKLEFYGKINIMKAGLLFADLITTVSPTYSREIQTPEYGFGLDGVLRERKKDICGILNGIDYDIWNPLQDSALVKKYSLDNLEGKRGNKIALQRENNLPVVDVPLIGVISRLCAQKGLDLIEKAFEEMMGLSLQFVLLGTGERNYNNTFEQIGKRFPQKTAIHITFDPEMARRIYAGADLFLMPSHYEPCGLGQMISLRYGTIPVVRKTGGLADTVKEFNPLTEKGEGFVFEEYSSQEMIVALKRAISLYNKRDLWLKLLRNAMQKDYSWNRSANEYSNIYENLLDRLGQVK
jgi:starch synthase